MPFLLNEDGSIAIDEYGNKTEFDVLYTDTNDWYIHKEALHVNDNDQLDTENRHLIIKDGTSSDHAISKRQLDQLNKNIKQYIDNELRILQNLITSSINNLKSQMLDTASKPNSNNFNNFNNRFNN